MTDVIKPPLHPDDQETLRNIRVILAGNRIIRQLKQKDITAQSGLGDTVVSSIERGDIGPLRLQNLCKYAAVFDLAVKVSFSDLELDVPTSTPELDSLQALSDAAPYNGLWLEALVIAFLRHTRVQLHVPIEVLAPRLGLNADTLSRWENASADPHLTRMMAYARQLGGVMHLELVTP